MKETDMLVAKIDLLMKQLTERNQENPSNSVKAIDSHMTCEVYGEVGHSGNDCPETLKTLPTSTTGFANKEAPTKVMVGMISHALHSKVIPVLIRINLH